MQLKALCLSHSASTSAWQSRTAVQSNIGNTNSFAAKQKAQGIARLEDHDTTGATVGEDNHLFADQPQNFM